MNRLMLQLRAITLKATVNNVVTSSVLGFFKQMSKSYYPRRGEGYTNVRHQTFYLLIWFTNFRNTGSRRYSLKFCENWKYLYFYYSSPTSSLPMYCSYFNIISVCEKHILILIVILICLILRILCIYFIYLVFCTYVLWSEKSWMFAKR